MKSKEKILINVQSEVGRLEAVLLHAPGEEVENMTPKHAQRALYSDILNLSIAQKEYQQLSGVLNKVTSVYQLKDLLTAVLKESNLKEQLLRRICENEERPEYYEILSDLSAPKLATALIEGVPSQNNSLTEFLQDNYYALLPLYNFYFTRDASVIVGSTPLICKMANKVRVRESLIMEAIFESGLFFNYDKLINANKFNLSSCAKIEGGDVIIVRDDILIIGCGARTNPQAIDELIINLCKNNSSTQHIFVQELPESPESFIHLDMVFTMLDANAAMVYKPLIMDKSPLKTVHIQIENGKVKKIHSEIGILQGLRKIGLNLETVICGGQADDWNQEREQWHSGANFFAIAPGKVLSYARNVNTIEELSNHQFEIVSAWDVINDKFDINKAGRVVITLDGSELARGGGGPRCMTMPLRRSKI